MAAKVRGITIEIGGDASGLEKALREVNSSIVKTQGQLKDVNRLLKLDPGNAELLAQKQKLLGQAAEQTAQKLETLKKASEKVKQALEDGEVGEDQYDALQREIANCTRELDNLEKQSREAGKALDESSSSATKFANAAQEISDKTRALSGLAFSAVQNIVNMGVNAAKTADELLTLSNNTGLSTDSLQAMQQAAEQIDVPVENITGALNRMKKNLDSQEETWNSIGVSVRDSAGDYRNIEDIFYETVEALGRIENETQRDKAAMDLFGNSASELAGLIDDGGQAFRELTAEASKSGNIIPREDLEAAAELDNQIQKIKTSFTAAFAKAGTQVAEALVPVFKNLGDVLGKVALAISKIPAPFLEFVMIALMIAAVISPITGGMADMIILAPKLAEGIELINGALGTLMANPVALTIMAVIAIIALLGFAIYEVVQHWDELSDAGQNAMSKIKDAVNDSAIFQHFKQDVTEMKAAFEDAGGGIKGAFSAALSYVKNGFETIFQGLTNTTDQEMAQIEAKIRGAFERAAESIRSFPDKVREALVNFKDIVEEYVARAFEELVDRAKNWGQRLAQNFTESVQKAIEKIKDAIGNVIGSIDNLIRKQNTAIQNQGNIKEVPSSSNPFGSGYSTNYNSVLGTNNPNINYQVQANAMNESVIQSLTNAINDMNKQTNVNVVLQGDAKGVFRLVRQENMKMINATGFHPLA